LVETPFVQVSTTWALTCPETVHQTREMETWLSDSRVSNSSVVDHTSRRPVLSPVQLPQPFNGLFSRTTWVSRYQKVKTNPDFTGARDSEWQWHQLGHMQVCTSLQTDNHTSTPPLCFLQAGCPSCRPTNSVKAQSSHQSSYHIRYIYMPC